MSLKVLLFNNQYSFINLRSVFIKLPFHVKKPLLQNVHHKKFLHCGFIATKNNSIQSKHGSMGQNLLIQQSSNFLCLNNHEVKSYSSCNNDTAGFVGKKLLNNQPCHYIPSYINFLRNWTRIFFVIQPYYDNEFDMNQFKSSSVEAVVRVSEHLASGNITALEGLIEATVLNEFEETYKRLNMDQRLSLKLNKKELLCCFPYELGLIFRKDESDPNKDRVFFEIQMVYGALALDEERLQSMRARSLSFTLKQSDIPTFANFRFMKEVTRELKEKDSWTINSLNYIIPSVSE